MTTTDTPVSATETLNIALKQHYLRLAQPSELPGQRYLLECRTCGEVYEIQPWQSIIERCSVCGLSWLLSAPTFYVLLPDTVPVPEENG